MRGQSVLSLSHELIPGVVIGQFHDESQRLYNDALYRFGVMEVASSDGDFFEQETDSPETVHNHARYQAMGGEIVDIVKADMSLDDINPGLRSDRIATVVRTALGSMSGQSLTFIQETFTFDGRREFTYDLDAVDYTPEGQRVVGSVDMGLASEIAELLKKDLSGEQQSREDIEIRKGLEAVYSKAKEPRLRELRRRFPEAMEKFGSRCTDVHFNEVLHTIKGVQPEHEIGLKINPFKRLGA